MKSVILLFILLSKTLPLTVNYPNNMLLQSQKHLPTENPPIQLCSTAKYVTNNLQDNNINNTSTGKESINIENIISFNKTIIEDIKGFIVFYPPDICGVEIYKNQTSGLFIFDYKIMSYDECNNPKNSDIICNMHSNCNHAIKCCDLDKPLCINAFVLQKTTSKTIQNSNDNTNSCIANNNTECFSIINLYDFIKPKYVIYNKTTKDPGNKTTKAPSNNQQNINVNFLQLIYFSFASFFATL